MITFAQSVPPAITGGWLWGFVGVATALGAVLFCWNQLMKALGKSNERTITPQPLNVEIVKALHEQFAGKTEFERHVAHNTDRHGQIFASINRVERDAREALEKRFASLNEERAKTLVTLNTEFTFLRENVAAINRELKIRSEES